MMFSTCLKRSIANNLIWEGLYPTESTVTPVKSDINQDESFTRGEVLR